MGRLPRPHTKVMLNVGNPEQAFALSCLPNDGVGLVRIEFVISSAIQVHPMALIRFDALPAGPVKDQIAHLSQRYPHRPDYFVERLAEGVGQLAAASYPKEVIVQLSDFKTNGYAGLLGGEGFEPQEENPMLGFRGPSWYYDARYREGFLLECQAMKQVREEMGLTNVKLMIPFCRAVEEGKQVLVALDSLPNSQTLINAGPGLCQLSACFVLPVDNTMEGIFEAVKHMALVQRTGGGTGFAFARRRPKGEGVASMGGEPSGPVSFMKIFDGATEHIKQGGKRGVRTWASCTSITRTPWRSSPPNWRDEPTEF